MSTASKTYDPKSVEDRWYNTWLERGDFHAEPDPSKEPYCIVIPPPNVTGILHMGHALNNTIQDVLIRHQRMLGKDVVWVPGTDHASIATEGKVVEMLKEEGISKSEISREGFLEHAWEWREKYGNIIINQLKKLGCSCDWERTRFTMDDNYHDAVLHSFIQLYKKGLIYRGHRLVNWCPISKSAISDEEVIHQEVNGNLWHFRYPVVDSDEHVVVATTRPETMLGDTGVAINPTDQRYKHLIGKKILLPLVGREMPVIADEHVDPEFGTGCVKVTPAHDPNDFMMGEKHGLEFINIMNDDASMNDNVPEKYRGLSRDDARKQVVADLEQEGLLEKTDQHVHQVGYSQRGHEPIEYYMSEQWFMKMDELAKPALKAVLDGTIKMHPEHWVKTYQYWMENITDWCISRQLWWGHRIPVWYKKGADRNDVTARHVSIEGPPDPEKWEQDEDVLDTWASSWLWPFAVHEWPEEGPCVKQYYPSAVLVTGPDIIFFWVARMIMAGYEFMGGAPFSDVYLHGIVRDDTGRKMSKSLGNSMDPLEVVEKYSADALRFSMMMLTATGQDILLSDEKVEVGRNFGTKLWNAARFMQMYAGDDASPGTEPNFSPDALSPDDQHLLDGLNELIAACDSSLERFRLNDYAHEIYHFLWGTFCDWSIEYAKGPLNGADEAAKAHTLEVMNYTLGVALRLLHPLMPFITEELWHVMGYAGEKETIQRAPWPKKLELDLAKEEVAFVEGKHELIRLGRNLRATFDVPAGQKGRFILRPEGELAVDSRLEGARNSISTLMRAEPFEIDNGFEPDKALPSVLTPLGTLYMPLEGLIDAVKELEKLSTQQAEVEKRIANVDKKLANEKFVSKAPADVVARQRELREELLEQRTKVAQMAETLRELQAT